MLSTRFGTYSPGYAYAAERNVAHTGLLVVARIPAFPSTSHSWLNATAVELQSNSANSATTSETKRKITIVSLPSVVHSFASRGPRCSSLVDQGRKTSRYPRWRPRCLCAPRGFRRSTPGQSMTNVKTQGEFGLVHSAAVPLLMFEGTKTRMRIWTAQTESHIHSFPPSRPTLMSRHVQYVFRTPSQHYNTTLKG